MSNYPVTQENAGEHAATLRTAYDPKSPFYRMVNCREFWERDPEEKALVMPHLPAEIVEHINELFKNGEL